MEKFFTDMQKKLTSPEQMWPVQNNGNSSTEARPQISNSNNQTLNPNSSNQQIFNTNKMNEKDCKKFRKVIVKTLTLANGTAAGTYSLPADFGKEYKRLVGYYFIPTSIANLTSTQVKIGLSDGSRTILDPVLLDYHSVSTSVRIQDRFNKEELIELISGGVSVNITIAAALTNNMELQMLALVERD